MSATHGLAASIRSAEEHETFDLGGMTVDSIVSTLAAAFLEPFPVDTDMPMIRLTFVVGAGKQNRQKYDAGATKATVTALMNCGYQEDKGASCVLACAGFYKQQHDTGKNLKTVVVFPKFKTCKSEKDAATTTPEFMDTDSIPYKVAVGSTAMLENMVIHKCPTWSQKKTLLGILEDLSSTIASLDDKLIHGTLLNGSEQAFYDEVIQLSQKQDHVKEKLHAQVEQGKVTAYELRQLKDHNTERLQELQQQGKPTGKALQRKELLDSITTPVPPLQLKYHAELGKLWKQVGPLLQLEQEWKAQGDRLLTVKETQTMGKKEELLQAIDDYEQTSRGWLEDDDMFQSRLQACRQEFGRFLAKKQSSSKSKAKRSGSSTGGGGTMISSSTKTRVPAITKWSVPSVGGSGGGRSTAAAKKKSKLQKGDLFGAMMVDSDSEEEEEGDSDDDNEDDDDQVGETPTTTKSTSTSNETKPNETKQDTETSTATNNKSNSNSKKSKKKKKNKSNNTGSQNDDQVATSISKDTTLGEDESSSSANSHILVQILSILVSILVAILMWIVSLLFGKPKTTTSKKKN
jgi:hypothetical protein